MNSELFLFLKGTFHVPFRVDFKKRDRGMAHCQNTRLLFFGGRLMWIHAAHTDYILCRRKPLNKALLRTEGIHLVQQRQNTMFRMFKKKLETLLKHALQKHFGNI